MSKISIRLSNEEEAALREVAERTNVTVSEVIRACIGEKFPHATAGLERESAAVAVVREELGALDKWGRNFERAVEKLAEKVAEIASAVAKGEDARRVGGELQRVVMSAHQTQHAVEEAIEEMCRHLQKHCHETVPAQISRSLAAMAKEELALTLQPLETGISKASYQVGVCHEELAKISWSKRLITGTLYAGFIGGMVAGGITAGMARYSAAEVSKEARRYEILGRAVQERLAGSSPKERQAISDWINGVSLTGFKKGQ